MLYLLCVVMCYKCYMCEMYIICVICKKKPECSLANHSLPPAQDRPPKSKSAVGCQFSRFRRFEMFGTFGIPLTCMIEAFQDARMVIRVFQNISENNLDI